MSGRYSVLLVNLFILSQAFLQDRSSSAEMLVDEKIVNNTSCNNYENTTLIRENMPYQQLFIIEVSLYFCIFEKQVTYGLP